MEERAKSGLHVALLSYRGNMFCGGQGVYLYYLARALVELGHRVRVFSGPPYPDPVPGAETEFLPDENFINKPAFRLPANPLHVFKPLNFLEYGLARSGMNPEMLAFSLRCHERLRSIHRNDPFDVVHDNQGLGYGLLLIRNLGIPVVATIHHPLQVDRREDINQTKGLRAKIKRAVYYPVLMQKVVARGLDRVISVSDFSADLIARTYGLCRENMVVAPNGIDADLFRPLPGVEREAGRLLFVGSSEDRKKGVYYLLAALSGLPARFHLVIVDGRRYPGRVYAETAASELGVRERVEFRDGIDTLELVKEYNRAQLMVVPSLFEGFGLPALEAMACGTPLVCSTAGALPEVVSAECAYPVPPRSAAEIRKAVEELSDDKARLARMSLAGRERAESMFSWRQTAGRVEGVYREAVEARLRGHRIGQRNEVVP